MRFKKTMIVSLAAAGAIALSGCGGGGGSEESAYNGRFVDGPVDGVSYTCGTVSAKTHDGGLFGACPGGSKVVFRIGGAVIASATEDDARPNGAFFIEDLVGTDAAVKAATLLLSLDTDPNDDVITLPTNADDIVAQVLPEGTTDIGTLPEDAVETIAQEAASKAGTVPVSPDQARTHLEETAQEVDNLPDVPPVTGGNG